MDDRDNGGGFTVLDGVALVLGAAVASVHLRALAVQRRDLTGLGWALLWITFTGVAISAAGPFLFLQRRFIRRPRGYPRPGDWLWALLGVPWCLTVGLRPSGAAAAAPAVGPPATTPMPYSLVLGTTLALASLVALGVVWNTWVLAPPRPAGSREPTPWTDRVGLMLAVAWPLQCGFGLVMLG